MSTLLRVHAILHGTAVNGPGIRTAIWVQGCSLGCPGCWNPETWAPGDGTDWEPAALAREVARTARPDTRGLTLSGGEPFQQAEALAKFVQEIRDIAPAWDVFCWTGYTLGQLRRQPSAEALLDQIDLLVDGRYIERLRRDDLPWRGSRNQRILPLTLRGAVMATEAPRGPEAEYHIAADGTVVATGFPPVEAHP